ncbi:hypothetical protein [Mucilaginibacter sp. FT3.2]|uniref:hypothetical protein n=1 Tax=Mucilaginibacter sp. FT3.2 TaxID=2723090 RepID=UPI0016229768|nr:hypothetical protein [Mucilaginibacter sp. FT3.2]MBB6230934.1 hypothetical protein [Mucilaginibacter sp. FT3.2]
MLEKEVSPRSNRFLDFGRSAAGTYFKDYALNGEFEFEPDITGRNSFNPQIKGEIVAYKNGSRIIVKMGLHPVVLAFICVVTFFLFCAIIAILSESIIEKNVSIRVFIPLALLLFIYLMTILAYKSESTPAKDRLIGILSGEIIEIK